METETIPDEHPPPPLPKPTTGPLQFTDLSADIKSLIVGHVIRPTDMKSLCLTCRELHEITVRWLYREVSLDVGSPHDTNLSAFLNPRNIGLRHVRSVDLFLADVIDKCNQLQQANFAVRMMLEFLPENTLEKFSWHPWSPFSADNLMLLYRKQKRLNWMEGIALDRDVLPEMEKMLDLGRLFRHTRKLGLYPDSREVLRYCNFLVRNTPQIDKITLHSSFDDLDPPISARELNDMSTGPGLITRTLFSHMLPFDKCKPLCLKELTFQKINLRYAAETYCRVVDFVGLTALRVNDCAGADALFAELSKSTRLPRRLEVLEFKHEDNAENDGLNALDGFLRLVSGVQVMTIDLCFAKTLPAAASITPHFKTLRGLSVHARPDDCDSDELVYGFEAFSSICKDCSLIEQLSVGFPPTSLIRANSEAFAGFEHALGHLPNLITLNVTTWPNNNPSTTRLPRKIYEHLLQHIAQQGFERSAAHAAAQQRPGRCRSRLAVIAFGSSDRVYDREDSKNQIIFVRGRMIDPFGVESVVATRVGWCLRKYIEPRSDVLDFSLAHSSRPPTREPASGDDSL